MHNLHGNFHVNLHVKMHLHVNFMGKLPFKAFVHFGRLSYLHFCGPCIFFAETCKFSSVLREKSFHVACCRSDEDLH